MNGMRRSSSDELQQRITALHAPEIRRVNSS